jgi:Tfp pilus assembly protein FimT
VRNDKKARAVFEKLESEIYATIKYFKHEGHYLSKHILVSGIGTNLPNIEQYISEDFDKTVSKLVLPETIQYADDVPKFEEEDFSVNIGLLLDPKDRLNLLPEEQRSNTRFIYPLNLGKIAAAILILLGSIVSINNYFETMRLESEAMRLESEAMRLKSEAIQPESEKKSQLSSLAKENNQLYDISYKLAVADLIHGTKAYDKYLSKKVVQVLKFLTSALPEAVLFDRLVFSMGEDGKTPVLTLMGRISSSGAESNIVLNNMMFYLKDYEMLKQVTPKDRNQNPDGSRESGTVNFTVDLNL